MLNPLILYLSVLYLATLAGHTSPPREVGTITRCFKLALSTFFFMSIQMLMGIIGEYIGTIHTLVQKRPLVVEQETINFEYGLGEPLRDNEAQPSAK